MQTAPVGFASRWKAGGASGTVKTDAARGSTLVDTWLDSLSRSHERKGSAVPPGNPTGAALPGGLFGLSLELGELDRESEGSCDLAQSRTTTRAVPTIGATAARTPRTWSTSMSSSLAAPRFSRYDAGGASTATSAAMRTSMSVCGSRLDASIESAVMLASRSSTGVSVVSAMGISFQALWARQAPRPVLRTNTGCGISDRADSDLRGIRMSKAPQQHRPAIQRRSAHSRISIACGLALEVEVRLAADVDRDAPDRPAGEAPRLGPRVVGGDAGAAVAPDAEPLAARS